MLWLESAELVESPGCCCSYEVIHLLLHFLFLYFLGGKGRREEGNVGLNDLRLMTDESVAVDVLKKE